MTEGRKDKLSDVWRGFPQVEPARILVGPSPLSSAPAGTNVSGDGSLWVYAIEKHSLMESNTV